MTLPIDDGDVVDAIDAIHSGDVERLEAVLQQRPELVTARFGDESMTRTLLHAVADWPGHFPNGAATVRALVDAGADPNARFTGPHRETPLHWAASSDDVEVLDALLDAGADIEADGAVIAGGTALTDATAFGQWNAARRLVERGASAGFWEASAMGLDDRVRECLDAHPAPARHAITRAFWGACHGGRLSTAQLLLDAGADPEWLGWDELTPLGAAERAGAPELVTWLEGVIRSG